MSTVITPILIGLVSFFAICGIEILNPTNIAWISPGDPTQHYLGWEFYRHSPLSLPLGLNPTFGLDIASSIVYSDSIPIVAVLLKPFSQYLSEPFQYLGVWYLLCFVLQAWFSWLLVGLVTKDAYIKVVAVILFTLAPAFLCLLGITAALSSHFLILAALYLALRKNQTYRNFWWSFLLAMGVGIHFYLFVMILGIWISDLLDKILIQKLIDISAALREAISVTIFVGFTAWLCGYFIASGSTLAAEGYGDIANKLNPFAIIFDRQWSFILFRLPQIISWQASNNFLGVGLVGLLFTVLLNCKDGLNKLKNLFLKNGFLVLLLIFYFFFSITNNIDIGIFHISYPLPDWLLSKANILRGSTRVFWPNYYLLILVLIFLLTVGYSKRNSYLILFFVTLIQIIDTGNGWVDLRKKMGYEYMHQASNLSSPIWKTFGKNFSRVVLVPEISMRIQFETFATFAATHKLATNSVLLARPDLSKVAQANHKFDLAMASGAYDPESLYIIDDDLVIPVSKTLNRTRDLFARIDGFNVLAPGWLVCDSCFQVSSDLLIKAPELPIPKLNTSITFGSGGSGTSYLLGVGQFERLGWGWAYPESWGVWSEGRQSKLLIPYPKGAKPTSVTFVAKALIAPNHPTQRVEIWVNNQLQKSVTLDKFDGNLIGVNLPKDTARDFVLIEFRFPDAISAKELGIGDDVRKLSIGLESGVLR